MADAVSTQTPSVLVFNDTDDFNSTVLNKAFSSLDIRLRAMEALSISYQDAVNTLNLYGLARLNSALQPVYDAITKISQLGQIFTTTSTSSVTLGTGTKIFTVAAADQKQFAAAGYILAVSSNDITQTIAGRTQSYDRDTGTLTILADTFEGTAGVANDAWTITAAVDVNMLKQYIDQAVAKITGTADAAGDTLGELEALVNAANTAITNLNTAVAQANSAAAQGAAAAQAAATATATSNALALAIALG